MTNTKPNLVFPVISDVHIQTDHPTSVEKLAATLKQFNEIAQKQDAFVVVGDLTEGGGIEHYDKFMSAVAAHKQANTSWLIAIGNHDYWNDMPVEVAQARFLEKTGMGALHFKKVINGYNFIILGTEDGCTEGTFTSDQLNWLAEQLEIAAQEDPNKPIFVFQHQPLPGTVYGSEWGIQNNPEAFYDVLKKYPQVMNFSGHTHFPLYDPKIVHQKDFTSIGTGTSGYMFLDDHRIQGEIPEGANDMNHAWLVEVYDDEVVLNRRDITNNRWIDEPFVVKCPIKKENFVYTDDRDKEPPYFETDATISVIESETTQETVTLAFSQAKDNLFMHDYKIVVSNANSGENIRELLTFSEFYKDSIPNPMVVSINELEPNTRYHFEVWAMDAFENLSIGSLKIVANTKG